MDRDGGLPSEVLPIEEYGSLSSRWGQAGASALACIGSAPTKARRRRSGARFAVKYRYYQSGGQPFVMMMEAANLRKGNYLTRFSGLDRPWHGTVLTQRKVSARLVIVVQIRSENSPQVPFAEHDEVIKALSPDRSDHPFSVGILPWRARCRDDFVDPVPSIYSIQPKHRGSCRNWVYAYTALASTDNGRESKDFCGGRNL
jgi:hypothetical protein